MGGRVARRDRNILPVRQDVNGNKVRCGGNVAVTQPELPDIGIGDRHLHLSLDRPDGGGQIGRRHFATQQHFVADDNRYDRTGISVGKPDRVGDLFLVLDRIGRQPQPLQNLQAMPGGNRRHLVDAVIGRIGPHAAGNFGQLDEVDLDLGGRDHGGGVKRRLAAMERRVGQAIELVAGRQGRFRHRHRLPQPGPTGGDAGQDNGKA